MRKLTGVLLVFLFAFTSFGFSFDLSFFDFPTLQEAAYYDALQDVKEGHHDYAYIKLREYVRERPRPDREKKARFSMAEYLLEIKNYRDAIKQLAGYLEDYPDDPSRVFAQALLYKALTDFKQDPELIERIKLNFFSRSLFLIFSESKSIEYESIFKNVYRITEYVDRIEIFKNNELFLDIAP
ncbi:MAG: hypothetical protein PHE18_02775 [Candidatus Omnitrophica bacterium]|nr:hypothetical protein [Candidatus Omnitrophota bacterium]